MAAHRGDTFERKVLQREVLLIYRLNSVSPRGFNEELNVLISCRPEVMYFVVHFLNLNIHDQIL